MTATRRRGLLRRRVRFRTARPLALVAWLTLLAAPHAAAQPAPERGYVLEDAGAFTLEYMPGVSQGVAEGLVGIYQRAAADVALRLGVEVPPRPHAVLAPTDAEFERRWALLSPWEPPPGALAVAFPARRLVIIRQRGLEPGSAADLHPTLRHELAHLALGSVSARFGGAWPRWLEEGLAEFAAGRALTSDERASLSAWSRFGELPALDTLATRFPAHAQAGPRAYMISFAFVSWLESRGGVRPLLALLREGVEPARAVARVAGAPDLAQAELDWRVELLEDHSALDALRRIVDLNWVIAALAVLAALRTFLIRRRERAELARAEAGEGEAGLAEEEPFADEDEAGEGEASDLGAPESPA